MKKLSLVLIAVLFVSLGFSQTFDYKLQVKNKKGLALKGVEVWMKEKKSGETITQKTDINGVVNFKLPGGYWSVNLEGLPNYIEFEVKPYSSGEGGGTISYDIESIIDENTILKARSNVKFEIVDQTREVIVYPAQGYAVVKIKIIDANRRSVKGVKVALLSTKQAKKYITKSGYTGYAKFLVPTEDNYIIDIDGVKNMGFTNRLKASAVYTLSKFYEKNAVEEININDTIWQKKVDQYTQKNPVRFLVTITVLGASSINENVYLENLTTHEVYVKKTDKKGKAYFLLPKGVRYMVHFEFQKDVDVINLVTARGEGSAESSFHYNPDPKLQHPENYLPTAETVFIKEFQSFMTKNLPEPKQKKVGLFLKWGNKKVNTNSQEAVLQIGISATNNKNTFSNVPNIDIAFVIDKSGSMAGYDRIESLKKSMISFSDKLRPNDQICLVSFDTEAYLNMPLKKNAQEELKQKIAAVEAIGGTNIYKGMVMGYEQLLKSKIPNRTKQLILLTDGYGTIPPKEVVEKSKKYTAKGIHISAIGVGDNYNYGLLKLLTAEQGGFVAHAGKSEEIHTAFSKQLSNLTFPIAKKATIEILFNRKIQFEQLYGADVKTKSQDKITMELGALYKGYNKVALAQFNLHQPNETIQNEAVIIKLTYQDIATKKVETVEEKASLSWDASTGKLKLFVEQEQQKMYAIAIINQSVKVMIEALNKKDYGAAKKSIKSAQKQVKELFPKAEDEDVKDLIKELSNYVLAINAVIYKKGK